MLHSVFEKYYCTLTNYTNTNTDPEYIQLYTEWRKNNFETIYYSANTTIDSLERQIINEPDIVGMCNSEQYTSTYGIKKCTNSIVLQQINEIMSCRTIIGG